MANHTRGRGPKKLGPRKLMPEQIPGAKGALVCLLERDRTVAEACVEARVGRSTFYQWLQRDRTFATAVDLARPTVSSRISLSSSLEEKTSRELRALLERVHPRYRRSAARHGYW